MKKLALLIGALALVAVTLIPEPAYALTCNWFCNSGPGRNCEFGCGQLCNEWGQCTCGCLE